MTERLTRSNDRFLGGVCAGLAEYFNLDVSLVRISYALISVFSAAFPGLLVYIILWIVIPPKY
jgi:phage shock protein C